MIHFMTITFHDIYFISKSSGNRERNTKVGDRYIIALFDNRELTDEIEKYRKYNCAEYHLVL